LFGLDTRVLRIVYTLAACYLVYLLRDVLLLMLLSVVAAYMLYPAVETAFHLVTRKRHRGGALVLVFVGIVTVILVVGGVVGYYAFQEGSSMAQQIPALMEPNAIRHIKLPGFLQPWDPQIRQLLENWEETDGKHLVATLTSLTLKLLTVIGGILSLLVVLLLSFLLLKNGEAYAKAVLEVVPRKYENAASAFLRDMHKMMQDWTRAIVVSALATVALYAISFALMSVPDSVLLAMVAFPFEFIPLIGPPAAFSVIMLVSYANGYHHMVWLIVIFLGVRLIQDYVLQPLLMSSGSIELPPFVVIFGALAGEAVAGIPGLLLSIPVIATVRLLYRHFRGSGTDGEIQRLPDT
jgi:predicted PurR-regulated permease PerM